MSLILEALKQADSERGHGSVPGVFSQPIHPAEQPAPSSRRSLPVWLLLAAAAGAALLWFTWPHTPWGVRPTTQTQPTHATPTPVPAPVAVPPQAPPANAALFQPEPVVAAPSAPAATATLAVLPTAHTPAPRAEPPVPGTTDLPAETRARLPSVQISGHTYSDHAALRTLMIDGRMVMEGQAVSPGLRVERIGPHQAVFSHRGTRFSVDY
jgi:general secretion pathway protein B